MIVKLFRVILPVGDVDDAASFYGALLGSPGERVSGGRHYFDCGGTILACVDPRGEGQELRPNIDHVYFSVDELDRVYGRAKAAGCSWLGEDISVRPWGERSFFARDPWGNPICFVEAGTEFTGGRFVP
ncbi:MAG TPA: VOC family protein [Dehalococcoidia bacterium]|nr:VOC family protein [Dehalococcoidia bacterium]